jgi:hypothetical protein
VNSQIAQSANQLFQVFYRNMNANFCSLGGQAGMARFVSSMDEAANREWLSGCDVFWCAGRVGEEILCAILVRPDCLWAWLFFAR